MKSTFKIVFVILTAVLTLAAVQNVGAADTYNVTGTIDSMSYRPNVVEVDGTQVYGMKFDYLCNQYTICLQEGEVVSIWYFEFLCDDGTTKAMASSITVGDVTVVLR